MLHWRLLRFLGRCCLEKMDLLVAASGGAAEVLLFSLDCPLPLLSPPPPFHCYSVAFLSSWRWEQPVQHPGGWRNLFLFGKQGCKSHLRITPGFSCIKNLKIVHSQPFAGAYIHADKAGSKKGACFADGFEDHAA